jgi:hypothetical protein
LKRYDVEAGLAAKNETSEKHFAASSPNVMFPA